MPLRIEHSTVEQWAANYDGPLFHALLCDPPYHLISDTRNGSQRVAGAGPYGRHTLGTKGFMGKEWDGGGVAFDPETWASLRRHMLPGAFGFAFASSRGWHRMACAIEDAGFVFHPTVFMLGWAFGCLSEDTEILTRQGWVPYYEAVAGREVLCYSQVNDSYQFEPVQELLTYDYDETAYHIQSSATDQLVSRNHRCLVERGGRLKFEYAEALACCESVPVLENLSELQAAFRRSERGAVQCAPLLHGVPAGAKGEESRCVRGQSPWGHGGRRVHCLRQDEADGPCVAQEGQAAHVFASMQREGAGADAGAALMQGASGLDGRIVSIFPREDEWPEESGVEGWHHLSAPEGQLRERAVRALPDGILKHGAAGRLRDGASACGGAVHRSASSPSRIRAPRQSQTAGQRSAEPDAVRHEPGSQAVRASRYTRTTVARVEPVHYRGVVWCVRVPSGAFVARRNGKVFITGNSGFPKATRVRSEETEETEETEELTDIRSGHMHAGRDTSAVYTRKKQKPTGKDIAFAGHRYGRQALKPALEPIVVFSNPQVCYPEIEELASDVCLLLEDLWIKHAGTAEDASRAASAARTVLANAATSMDRSAAASSASDAGSVLPAVHPRLETELASSAHANAKTSKRVAKSRASIAASLSTSPLLSSPTTTTDTAAESATESTTKTNDGGSANSVGSSSSPPDVTDSDCTVRMTAGTSLGEDLSSQTHCETAIAISTRAAMLQYNSERAVFDLNTIWSWNLIWADVCDEVNRSTIAMTPRVITALRILSCSLRRLTHASRDTASKKSSFDGLWSYASDVNGCFSGLSTCLMESPRTVRPASQLEPIVCFQNPYVGKPVECITGTGAGALNIDAARIGESKDGPASPARDRENIAKGRERGRTADTSGFDPSVGRWPANLLLCHLESCTRVGIKQVKSNGHFPAARGLGGLGAAGHGGQSDLDERHMAGETVEAWQCADGCAVAALNAQAGDCGAFAPVRGTEPTKDGLSGAIYGSGKNRQAAVNHDDGQGAVSRFFYNADWSYEIAERIAEADAVRYEPKADRTDRDGCAHPTMKPVALATWLAKLLLPPKEYAPRRLLVPFAGVGSEMLGASFAGWDEIVGIEQDEASVTSARNRFRDRLGLFASLPASRTA